jgi:hypothetical protein
MIYVLFLCPNIANSKTGVGFREIFQFGKGFDSLKNAVVV